jgi:hypothetical protein
MRSILVGSVLANAAAMAMIASNPRNIYEIGNVGDDVIMAPEGVKSTMQELSDQIASSLGGAPRGKMPNPVVQGKAEAKRIMRAEKLRKLADKGSIGIQVIDPPEQPEEVFATAVTQKLGDAKPKAKRPAKKTAAGIAPVVKKVTSAVKPKKPATKKPAAAPGKKGMPAAKKPAKKSAYEA